MCALTEQTIAPKQILSQESKATEMRTEISLLILKKENTGLLILVDVQRAAYISTLICMKKHFQTFVAAPHHGPRRNKIQSIPYNSYFINYLLLFIIQYHSKNINYYTNIFIMYRIIKNKYICKS